MPPELNTYTGVNDVINGSTSDHMPLVSCKDIFPDVDDLNE